VGDSGSVPPPPPILATKEVIYIISFRINMHPYVEPKKEAKGTKGGKGVLHTARGGDRVVHPLFSCWFLLLIQCILKNGILKKIRTI
jgi:hypothetical protein